MSREVSSDRQELERLDLAVVYFKEQGLQIEVCGGIRGNALVIDFIIGKLTFPDSLISTGVSTFAIVPKEQFEKLEKSGAIVDATDKEFANLCFDRSLPARIGKTSIEIKGIMGSKKYQSVSVVGLEFPIQHRWKSILGLEFILSFDVMEMHWPGDTVVGFYGCRKIKS